MPRIYLDTTYEEKDVVKDLGARWDPVKRKWFVPAGQDLAPFSGWLPDAQKEPAPPASAVSRVLLIGGRNRFAEEELRKFLTAAGLTVWSWPGSHVLTATPESEPGDSEAFPRTPIIGLLAAEETATVKPSCADGKRKRELQSHQPGIEAVFNIGLALGAAPARTLIVQMGHIRTEAPSLVAKAIKLDNSIDVRQHLLTELEALGSAIDWTGNWEGVGDLESFMRGAPPDW